MTKHDKLRQLLKEQIRKVIQPIVNFERENYLVGNPFDYLSALHLAYTRAIIISEEHFEAIQL